MNYLHHSGKFNHVLPAVIHEDYTESRFEVISPKVDQKNVYCPDLKEGYFKDNTLYAFGQEVGYFRTFYDADGAVIGATPITKQGEPFMPQNVLGIDLQQFELPNQGASGYRMLRDEDNTYYIDRDIRILNTVIAKIRIYFHDHGTVKGYRLSEVRR